jgi:hypothetical protein
MGTLSPSTVRKTNWINVEARLTNPPNPSCHKPIIRPIKVKNHRLSIK